MQNGGWRDVKKHGNPLFTGEKKKKTLIFGKRKQNWSSGRSDCDTLLANIYQHADESQESVGKLRRRHHKIETVSFFFPPDRQRRKKEANSHRPHVGRLCFDAAVRHKEQHVPGMCLLQFAFVCASNGHPTRGGRNEGTNCWSEGGCGRLMRATSPFWAHKFVCLI